MENLFGKHLNVYNTIKCKFGKYFSDDSWDARDAHVVCKMLGFANDSISIPTTRSKFGRVSTDFIISDVRCGGPESHISLCSYHAPHNCGASDGAGVMCDAASYQNITLVGGNINNMGNVLLNGKPIW